MGFFIPDEQSKELEQATPAKVARRRPAPVLDTSARGCDACSLRAAWPQLATPRMKMTTTHGADILILGSVPSLADDRAGVPFSPDNKYAAAFLKNTPKYARDRFAFQNVARCASLDTATMAAAHACSVHLEDDIRRLKPVAIIGVGQYALSQHFSTEFARMGTIHGVKFPVEIAGHVCWFYPVHDSEYVEFMGGDTGPAQPVQRANLTRFFREVDTWPKPEIVKLSPSQVTIVTDEAEAMWRIDALEDFYGFDIETSALRPYVKDATIATAAFADRNQCFAFSVGHPECVNSWGRKAIKRAINAKGKTWVAHNTGMELAWLWWEYGWTWQPTAYEDTMAQARLLHDRETLLSLGTQSRIHLGVNVKSLSDLDTTKIMSYPLAEVLPYNGLDALATILVYHKVIRDIERPDVWANYRRLLNTQRSIVAMELAGLPADVDEAKQLSATFVKKIADARKHAKTLYEVKEFERRFQTEFDIAKPEHVGRALVEIGKIPLPRTKKGQQYSTDDELLQKYSKENPLAQAVMDFREYSKLDSTYATPIATRYYEGVDGFIHPGYTSLLTATLRLSSEDPNIQNWPKRKHREIRRIVKAVEQTSRWLTLPKRRTIVAAFDYGQLEARVVAMLSRCKAFMKVILEGYDIHAEWRDELQKRWDGYLDHIAIKAGVTDEKKLLKAARDFIKSDFVFLSLFGGMAKTAAERIGAPLETMQQMQADLFRQFPGVKAWHRTQRGEYIDHGTCTMMTKRKRHAVMTGNEPVNNPIQGSAADIVIEGMNAITELAIKRRDPYLLPRINIHDDLTFFLPDEDDDELMQYIDIIAEEMAKPRFDWITVPLVVEVSLGPTWADLEEIMKVTGAYHR